MNRKMVTTITIGTFALVALLCAARPGRAADAKTPYPSMAPLDQYLMADRDAEIALARSAAPPSISSDATVMLLGRHGYETAVEGKNGFVCIEERAWNGSFEKDREFWNPKYRSPLCFNPLAALRTPDDEYALRHPHGQERGVVRNDVGPSETAKHADV